MNLFAAFFCGFIGLHHLYHYNKTGDGFHFSLFLMNLFFVILNLAFVLL